MPPELSLEERLAERDRCRICGLLHPFLLCPFVEEHEVRYEVSVVDGRRVRAKVERKRYYPRPEVWLNIKKLSEVSG